MTAAAYVSLDELKSYLGISASDTGDDAELTQARDAACRSVDAYCRRRFWLDADASGVRRYGCDAIADGAVWIEDLATDTGASVTVDSDGDGSYTTTWTVGTEFEFAPANRVDFAGTNWPITRLELLRAATVPTGGRWPIRVTGKWGWETAPPEVITAALIVASELYHRKDAPFGIAGFDPDQAPMMIREQPRVRQLLARYRRGPRV